MIFKPTFFNSLRLALFGLASVGLGYSQIAAAGTLIKYKDQNGQQYSVQLSGDRVGSTDGFYDLQTEQFFMLDHKAKAFSTMSRSQLEQIIQVSSQVMSQVEGLGQFLPPEYKASLEQASAQTRQLDRAQNFTMTKIGKDTIGGYACDKIEVKEAGKVRGHACVAKASDLKLPAEDVRGLEASIGLAKRLVTQLPGVSSGQHQQLELFSEGIPLSIESDTGKAGC